MKKPLIAYFCLAYALSWCVFIPLALAARGAIPALPAWLHQVGAFGPLLASLIVTAAISGKAGLSELFSRMTRWRIGWLWMGVALLSPVVVFLLASLGIGLLNGDWSSLRQFGKVSELPQLGWWSGWLVWILTFGLGEESGWRGFALPRLQKDHSARSASLVLGALWAGWHLPTFWYNYTPSLFGVLAFTIGILSGAALLTWLYNSTGGSLLATILWHGSYNAAVASAGGGVSAVVTAVVILAVIIIANRYGPETLSWREKQTL